eukprot:COSAG04_NODE_4188_length_2245_cov_4.831911_1_plen_522_part_00
MVDRALLQQKAMARLAALEAAMGEMEAARATFEGKAQAVSDELEKLHEQVEESNAEVQKQRRAIAGEEAKRRRRSGDRTPATRSIPNPDEQAEAAFDDAVNDVEERLQSARRAMARVHNETVRVRAGVDAAKASATTLCAAGRLADAKEARNEECSALTKLLGFETARGANHDVVLGFFSVIGLWRMRGVSRHLRRWCTAKLASLPRLMAVGGSYDPNPASDDPLVEVLDLSTLRWTSGGAVPALPDPRAGHGLCAFGDGRTVVAGGWNGGDPMLHLLKSALKWVRGAQAWAPLPDMVEEREGAAAVALPDGRAMVIGGWDSANQRPLASVEVLAPDGSGWSALAPMGTAREVAAAVVLPCGKVLVAGGKTARQADSAVKTAELWDPATGAWSDLPPMAQERQRAHCCVLPSGRVAVVGGCATDGRSRSDGEVFDPEARTWQRLPLTAHERIEHGLVAVAGGLLAIGGHPTAPNELFDEASGRWFELPHPMIEPRSLACLVPLPAAALAAAAAAAGAAAAP